MFVSLSLNMNQLGNVLSFSSLPLCVAQMGPMHTISLFGNVGSHCNIDLPSKAHQLQNIHVVRIVHSVSHIAVLCHKTPNRYHHGTVGVCSNVFMDKYVVKLMSVLYLPLLACLAMWVGHYIGHVCEAS